jgi:hypothetical protein
MPSTCSALPLRSTVSDELPTPTRDRRILKIDPGSIMTVTPLGTAISDPSESICPGNVPNPIS